MLQRHTLAPLFPFTHHWRPEDNRDEHATVAEDGNEAGAAQTGSRPFLRPNRLVTGSARIGPNAHGGIRGFGGPNRPRKQSDFHLSGGKLFATGRALNLLSRHDLLHGQLPLAVRTMNNFGHVLSTQRGYR